MTRVAGLRAWILGIGGGGNGAGVNDDYVGRGGIGGGQASAITQLALDRGAVGLGGAAAELFDVKGGHLLEQRQKKDFTTEITECTEPEEERNSFPAACACL